MLENVEEPYQDRADDQEPQGSLFESVHFPEGGFHPPGDVGLVNLNIVLDQDDQGQEHENPGDDDDGDRILGKVDIEDLGNIPRSWGVIHVTEGFVSR